VFWAQIVQAANELHGGESIDLERFEYIGKRGDSPPQNIS